MSLSRSETQVAWASATSKSVAAAGTETSDAVSVSESAIEGSLYIKADNAGTAADGDDITIKVLYTGGDTDADPDSADEYTTVENANVAAVINTYLEDPVVVVVPIKLSAKSFKVSAENGAAANASTISCQYVEKTAS